MGVNAGTTTHTVRLMEALHGERVYPPSHLFLTIIIIMLRSGQVIDSTELYYIIGVRTARQLRYFLGTYLTEVDSLPFFWQLVLNLETVILSARLVKTSSILNGSSNEQLTLLGVAGRVHV